MQQGVDEGLVGLLIEVPRDLRVERGTIARNLRENRACSRQEMQAAYAPVAGVIAPFDHPSVWTEVGPVYIHAARCGGYPPTGRLPEQLATGPRVLRTYRSDDTMNYDHNTVVTDEADLKPIIERLLSEPDVATVHVRTLAPQCFLYAVAAA